MENDIVPDSEFKPDADRSPASSDIVPDAQFKPDVEPHKESGIVPDSEFVPDEEKYGSLGQQAIAGLEGAAKGVLGPLAPAAERVAGVEPEDIRLRAEANPWTHGIGEAIGFGAGALTGTGEAALLGKAAEGVSALTGLGEATSIGGRLANGAAKMATEMGLMQVGDEASKVITQEPGMSIGDSAVNVGLSTLLGGATGGLFKGAGMAIKASGIGAGLSEMVNRIAARGAGLNPTEELSHEIENAMQHHYEMGTELGGANGLKSQALEKILPAATEENVKKINNHLFEISNNAGKRIAEASENSYLKGSVSKLEQDLKEFNDVITNPESSIKDKWDALNDYKRASQAHADYNKLTAGSAEKKLSSWMKPFNSELKESLENTKIWGKAGDFQKEINSAISSTFAPIKEVMGNFFQKVEGKPQINPNAVESYLRANGRSTSQTIRQQRLGGFVKSIENMNNAIASASEKAGIENPIQQIPTGAMKESLEKPSIWTKAGDAWFDKVGAQSIGNAAGALAGNAVAPGFGGAYIGKEILGPIMGSIIKPILEKGANNSAYQSVMSFGKTVLAGNNEMVKATNELFSGASKTIPQHFIESKDKVEKLDKQLLSMGNNPNAMLNVAHNLGHYAPEHAQELSKTAMTAVNYLNSVRPKTVQNSPLDTKIEPSPAQKMAYERTLSIAQNPLVVLHHIKNGTLLPSDVRTLHSVYPSYYNKMSQQIIHSMTDHISDGKNVPYNLRQSLSLFTGQPLDSTMTPNSIQMAQLTFMNKGQPQGQPAPAKKGKKNTSKLEKLSDNMMTQPQKGEQRSIND